MLYWSSGHRDAPSISKPAITWLAGALWTWMPDCLRTVEARPSAPMTRRGRTCISLPLRYVTDGPGTCLDAHFRDPAHEFRTQAHGLAGKGLARPGMGGAQGAAHAWEDG